MTRLFFFLLFLAVALGLEALFRWSNSLELDWAWLGFRAMTLGSIFLISGWATRRAGRREARTGKPGSGLLTAIFALLFGGIGLAVWSWRTADGFRTGKMLVALSPDRFTAWSSNPSGFAVAATIGILGVAVFLIFLVAGAFLLMDWLRSRSGPVGS